MYKYQYDQVESMDGVPLDMQDELHSNPDGILYCTSDPNNGAEAVWLLWYPSEKRAGVCWGGTTDWTDAISIDDAYERYFGIDDKKMES